jgi:hypothetical protein
MIFCDFRPFGVSGRRDEEVRASVNSDVCNGILLSLMHVSWSSCECRWKYNSVAKVGGSRISC